MQLFLKKEEEPFRTPLPSLYYYVQQMKIGFGGEKRGPIFQRPLSTSTTIQSTTDWKLLIFTLS